MRHARSNGLLICLLSLLVFLVVFTINQQSQLENINKLKTEYMGAMARTKVQFAGMSADLSMDPSLRNNLQWNLQHSISRTLETHLRNGELDYIEVRSHQDCNILAMAKVGKITLPCSTKTSPKTGLLQWEKVDGTAYLTLSTLLPVDGNPQWLIKTAVAINGSWLSQHPSVKSALNTLGLKLGLVDNKNLSTMTMTEAKIDDQVFGVQATTPAAMSRFTTDESALERLKILLQILAVACLILAIQMIWSMRQDAKSEQASNEGLLQWVARLANSVPPTPNAQTSQSYHECIRNLLSNYVTLEAEKATERSDENFSLLSDNRKKEAQIKRLEQQLHDYATLDSLALQINRSAKSLKTELAKLQTTSEDVVDILSHGVSRHLQTQMAVIKSWLHQINLIGARKFMRNMTETLTENNLTPLEESLKYLQSVSQSTEDQIVSAAAYMQRIIQSSKNADKIGHHWFDLSHEVEPSKTPCNLLEVVLAAQALQDTSQQQNFQLNNQFELGFTQVSFAPLSRPVAISLLYHMYAAFLEEVMPQDEIVQLNTAYLLEGVLQHRIKITLNQNSADLGSRIRSSHHLNILMAIASKYDLDIKLEDGNATQLAVSFGWTEETHAIANHSTLQNDSPKKGLSSSETYSLATPSW